jgi:hypothetical protein
MSELFGGTRSVQESLILISGNICERKLEKLHEKGCTEDELAACIEGMAAFSKRTTKDNLDVFKADCGEENFKLLTQNPKFDVMLKEFLQSEFEKLMVKAFEDIIALCEKYKTPNEDIPTFDEYKCMLHSHMAKGR